MVTAACGPQDQNRPRVDAAWMASTASQIVETMQERRSTWQVWHVHAEALRRVRGTNVARSDLDRVVDLLVSQTLDAVSYTHLLGVVGSGYHPLQNEEHAEFLNLLADESGAIFDTAGSLRGGRQVFVTMKLPNSCLLYTSRCV